MRHSDIRLRNRMSVVLVAALLVTLVFGAAASAAPAEPLAPDFPNIGHCFYGTVTTNHGIALPGTLVLAKAVAGYWSGSISDITDAGSNYGLTGASEGTFCIPGYDPGTGTGAKAGDLIAFFVGGTQASLFDVAAGKTVLSYPVEYGGLTQLNLIVPLKMTITATAGAGGMITPSGDILVDYGQDQSFAIAPNTGYDILDVKVDNVSQGPITAYTFTNVRANHTIAATFKLKTFVITAGAGTGGTISPSGDIVVDYGSNKTFLIAANPGFEILDVKVDDVSQGAISTYTFTNVTGPHTILATFKVQTFVITATAGLHGTINPSGAQTVNYGESKTFTIVPDPGYVVLDVKVDDVSQGAILSYTFSNVTANHKIDATFAKQMFKLYLPFILK